MVVDLDFYLNEYHGTVLMDDEQGEKSLNKAYRQINTICKNRLDNGTVDDMPEDIQYKVKTIVCEQADFNVENADVLNATLEEYTINGVSIKYATNNRIQDIGGILIKGDLLSELALYGLTYRGF